MRQYRSTTAGTIATFAIAVLLLAAMPGIPALYALVDGEDAPPAPEFMHQDAQAWINSPPLRISDLRGQVVLLDFWTYGCWNCYNSFPWLREVESRFATQGLKVIGVHTPEFEHEKVRANVVRKVAEFKLDHPVMIDNDFGYWKAMRNRYWPAFFLIDRQGRVRAVHFGETHSGDAQAQAIERDIESLLNEPL